MAADAIHTPIPTHMLTHTAIPLPLPDYPLQAFCCGHAYNEVP